MTAVVVPYPTDKAVIRCVISKVPGQNLAGEARKRYLNHERWLQIKAYDQKLQQERKKQAEELENQKKAQIAEELKRKESESKQKVQQWFKEKLKECEKKRKETMIVNLTNGANFRKEINLGNHVIQEWVKLKAKQKKIELKEEEERNRIEEEKINRRKALSGLCYEQWTAKAKQKQIEIPRNGYQIFGPKPPPVVRDEWITPELPKMSSSISAINNPKLFTISSFRSEPRMLIGENSERSYISKLDLGSSSAPLTPWGQVTGGYHARGVTKRTPALTWTDRSRDSPNFKDNKKQRKKKPHFRP